MQGPHGWGYYVDGASYYAHSGVEGNSEKPVLVEPTIEGYYRAIEPKIGYEDQVRALTTGSYGPNAGRIVNPYPQHSDPPPFGEFEVSELCG